jgi:hypothetical protein
MTPITTLEHFEEDVIIIILGFLDLSDVLHVRSVGLVEVIMLSISKCIDLYSLDMQVLVQSDAR